MVGAVVVGAAADGHGKAISPVVKQVQEKQIMEINLAGLLVI